MKKNILIILLLSFSIEMNAQKLEKDTVIDGITYHYVSYFLNGKLKKASVNKTKKNGGEWICFDKKGEEKLSGAYNKNGQKEGQWWYRKSEIIVYDSGKVIKKGKGCKGCPGF